MPIKNRFKNSTQKTVSVGKFFKCPFIVFICFIVFLLIEGCASKTQYEKISADYLIAQEQNKQLIQQIKELNREIKELEAVISLQMTVVRLFDDEKQTLQSNIKRQIASLDLESSAGTPPTALILAKNLFFQEGSASLNNEGEQQLEELKGFFSGKEYVHVQIVGHTDNSPLNELSKYANNLELSVARAISVAKYLHETFNVDEEKISVAGFGQYRPIASNDTPSGRYKNRRIEIVLETNQ